MNATLEIGEVVSILRPEGILQMTVRRDMGCGHYQCVWFEGQGELHQQVFTILDFLEYVQVQTAN